MDKSTNDLRFVIAQFCDDIRHEVGNKYSLIGCYREEMIVENLPVILPKLCVQVQVFTPIDLPFTHLSIRAKVNDEIVAELEMPTAPMMDEHFQRKAATAELKRASMVALIVLSPLAVTDECKVRIEAETEVGIIQGSILSIRKRTPEDSTSLH